MTEKLKIYSEFLGRWVLYPESCKYEQGNPPKSSLYHIIQIDDQIVFRIEWIDDKGENSNIEFGGIPNGIPEPFNGGELADEISIEAKSKKELNSIAFKQGKKRMIAQRQLDETGQAMRVTQVVYHDDGTQSANTGVYQRQFLN